MTIVSGSEYYSETWPWSLWCIQMYLECSSTIKSVGWDARSCGKATSQAAACNSRRRNAQRRAMAFRVKADINLLSYYCTLLKKRVNSYFFRPAILHTAYFSSSSISKRVAFSYSNFLGQHTTHNNNLDAPTPDHTTPTTTGRTKKYIKCICYVSTLYTC